MSTGKHSNTILNQLKHRQPQRQWLLRNLIVLRQNSSTSGFVLPTVAMVSLVIVLLTTAILVRSFDRSRTASNLRVSEAALNAATPALDRARAKIDALLLDQTLPQLTPTDAELENALNRNKYTLGDETRLKLAQDNSSGNNDTLTTAWKFPVDTDGNGKFDSYTLYGIYFRSNTAEEARNPLQARTPPMQGEALGRECENILRNSDRALGDSGWYQSGGKLSKSFFVYTVTVPITNPPIDNNYEAYRGNRSFYALEFQQDRSRTPIRNYAALFQNDLEITPDSTFRINGRIATNGNLLVGSQNNATTQFYQVSSQYSCFYNEENGKITVGGNVGLGNAADTSDRTAVNIDLFNGFGNNPITAALDRNIKSTTTTGGAQVSYNDTAYNHRLALMKQTALSYHPNFERRNTIDEIPPTVESVAAVRQYPPEVKAGFAAAIADTNNQRGSSLNAWDVLGEQIETYLRNLTRRVPYAEVATSDRRAALERYDFDGNGIDTSVFPSDTIEPPLAWREPTPINTRLTLNPYNLPQTQPEKQQQEGKESYVGDRIAVGNNLPTFWKKTGNFFLGFNEKQLFDNGVNWNNPNTQPRYRTSQTLPLPDRRIIERNGFWENAAAQQLSTTLTGAGGLRIITGAGIYDRAASFLPEPKLEEGVTEPPLFRTRSFSANRNIVVWSDALPMTGDAQESKKGDLQMRATAVYHYIDSSYTGTDYVERTPTACISSYYDPTTATTARNQEDLPDVSGVISGAQPANGRSNNGVVYPSPYNDIGGREAAVNQFREQLNFQASLIFPNGRVVNQPLRDALAKIDANQTRSLADNSAIDTAICAIRILDNSLSPVSNPIIPHGAIKEATFLDAREIKAIDKDNSPSNYDLELEKRQPLEIRVTDIDLGLLAKTEIGNERNPQEYLLPNSGIIYASRDDALADRSDTSIETKLLSPNDFILDSTRRPNGIRLINGSNLSRDENYREVEKGLTFVTNLPLYIRGDFNLHQQPLTRTPTEEFLERLTANWTNFYTRNTNFDRNFGCRKGQPGCGNNGDQWRPATIMSDAVTVLSNSFVDGFRSDGDYDLNNHIGNSVATQRKKNGFVDNSFATSVDSQRSTDRNSYLNNGVTPVQRRTNFPEYVMEICRKIPVSECKPNDWVVGYEGNKDVKAASLPDLPENAKADRLMAGTTARPALNPEDRRYPRRVAFQRNELGTLELSEFQNSLTPIPIGVNAANEVDMFPYDTYNTKRPKSVSNALWFRTTSNAEQPDSAPSYNSEQPLAYTPNTQLVSPSTPDIGTISLNLPEDNPISGYTICTTSGKYSKQYKFESGETLQALPNECGTDVRNQIQTVYEALRNLNPSADTNDDLVKATQQGNYQPGQETVITANDSKPINIVDLDTERIPTNNVAATTIRFVGSEESIFIIRNTTGQLQFGSEGKDHYGVNIELVGVSPNNIFWVINGNLTTNQVADDKRHSLAGTFLNNGLGIPVLKNVEINGRLLGFQDLPQKGGNFTEGSKITAITSDEQPLLIPVLQIHSPNGSPGGNTLDRGSVDLQDAWLQTPEDDTTVNAVFVSGNSPSRPGEEPAGLPNFVRLLENWRNRTLNIKGSFIQLHRSAYATAPFAPILGSKSSANDGSLSIFDYSFTQYRTNNGQFTGTLPYFATPNRQWSFDVALLAQSPDLFAQKFTQPLANATNEFVREVNRDDPWIETLLCAVEGSDNNYTYAVDASDRPQSCPALNAYQDIQTNVTP
ncbi:hormogonium polysaccharide biosynthesis protein HpsA [Chroococcidiopsis sp. TS-821]|uniref:hormogonium polysaccharide biosynthesis protein HpsA n=1 Tax=Chroococcidiopsis sp. TS-821 TaxID=1378066 RepID=UPI000CEEEC75|nr:hormogonium polysaccharide biosynthesis protein HpsA [Chroococcidiopsis sp. TS-821]PPS44735.1 hypothetical protein B1A85_00095 [Chroococcidiopsis sp. TS-821]